MGTLLISVRNSLRQINIFHSATIKLTALYVAILAVICLFFSINQYRISTSELDRGLGQQLLILKQNPQFQGFFGDDFITSRQNQLDEAKQHIIINLVEVDLLIIIIGGVGSYFLARRTLKPIQETHDAQVRFTADASHELRTPLAAMKTEIEVALRDPKFNVKEAETLLKSNLEELDKLTALSSNLLKLARNGEALELKKIPLAEAIKSAIERVSKFAADKSITLNSTASDLNVTADEPSLVQLLVILLDNAIKYSPENTTVRLKAHTESGRAVIEVKDEGHGIKATDLEHIFDRFYRADSSRSKEKVAGYGLGLSIAKKIVDSHHGTITAKSTLGSGSTFTVKLPS